MGRRRNTDTAAAIAYIRVSTHEQAEEGVSLAAQERAVRAYAALRGLTVVEVVTDAGVSAGKPLATREGGARVLEAVRRREAGAVVALKLDRLFRCASDCLVTAEEWERCGVALHLVDLGGQSIDTSSAAGKFMLTVLAGAAEMERNLVRERTRAAMAEKRQRGEYTGGEVPFGWRVGADGSTLVPHETEQEIVRGARELREAGLSLRAIGRELESRGLKTRSGKAWTHPQRVASLLQAEAA